MSAINQEDIFLILKLLEESPFDELQLDTGDLRLHARKKGYSRASEDAGRSDHQSSPGSGLETKRIAASRKAPA